MCVEATRFSILQSDFYLKLFFQFKVFTVFIFLVWFFSPLKQLNQFKDLAGFSYFYWLGVQKQWTFLILRGPDFVYISFPTFLLRNQPTFIWNHHLHVISCQQNHLKLFKILNFSTSLSLKATHPFFKSLWTPLVGDVFILSYFEVYDPPPQTLQDVICQIFYYCKDHQLLKSLI